MACEVLDVGVPAVEVLPLWSAVNIDNGRVGLVRFDVGWDVEEARDGCVDIYAVVRQGESESDVIGLNPHYRFSHCWVVVVLYNTNM